MGLILTTQIRLIIVLNEFKSEDVVVILGVLGLGLSIGGFTLRSGGSAFVFG